MGAKDTKAKEFLSDNRRFADLCNFYLFNGQDTIKAEELQTQDTTEVLSVFGVTKKELMVQKWRDLLKKIIIKRTDFCTYMIIGVENQTDIHYAMPVKNMIYDAINYGKQVNEAAKEHRVGKNLKNRGEFLSGFSKDDKLTPIVTLTLYWGADEWDAPRSIHDMLSTVEPEVLKFVPNYSLNLIVPGEITDFEKFRTSLGAVLEMIKYSKDEEAMNTLILTKPIYKDLENEAVKAINLFTGLELKINEEEKTMDMCKAWADHRQAGVKEGIKEGRAEEIIEMGHEFGLSEHDILDKLQKKLDISLQKAQEYFAMFAERK